jgi:choline dehydrogenase
MSAAVRAIGAIAAQQPLAERISGPAAAPASDSEEDIAAFVRSHCQTTYHPCGSCRMGNDEQAVVDPELRVRGVQGLRVVDASVFPAVPSGNTNAPVIAVAEKAADIIRGRAAPAETAAVGAA